MSIGYVRAALEMPEPAGLSRLLLIAIAEHANAATGLASPGNELLARETRISERQVQRLLHQLVDAGFIEIAEHGGGRGRVRQLRMLFAPAVTERAQRVTNHDTLCEPERATSDVALCPKKGDKRVTTERERVTNRTEKGDKLPEKTPDNQLEPITAEPIGVGIDPVNAAQPPASLPPAARIEDRIDLDGFHNFDGPRGRSNIPVIERMSSVKVHRRAARSPDFDPRKVGPDGLIPKGAGRTPLEVWREGYGDMPTLAQMRELRERVGPDKLDLWRLVVEQTSVAGFRSFANVMDVFVRGWKVGDGRYESAKQRAAGDAVRDSGAGDGGPQIGGVHYPIFIAGRMPKADPNEPF